MKYLILLSFTLIVLKPASAQFGTEHDITQSFVSPWDIQTCDLDSDGDLDILTSSLSNNTIGWLENVGGNIFSSVQILVTNTAIVFFSSSN